MNWRRRKADRSFLSLLHSVSYKWGPLFSFPSLSLLLPNVMIPLLSSPSNQKCWQFVLARPFVGRSEKKERNVVLGSIPRRPKLGANVSGEEIAFFPSSSLRRSFESEWGMHYSLHRTYTSSMAGRADTAPLSVGSLLLLTAAQRGGTDSGGGGGLRPPFLPLLSSRGRCDIA